MLNNEEDVKNQLVVPYLKLLGFHESELSFEKIFYLKVGRYTYRVDTEKQINAAQPRLDILIKRGNRNLCVVEVKDTSVTIGSDEIDQDVSYGRLVDPIVPICIITNGHDWMIVDTITKEKIVENNKLSESLNYNVSLPQQTYYEALQYFLGYSQENLLAFCQRQVNNYMEPLKGSIDDREKKYIEELYQVRKKVVSLLDTFVLSNSPSFVTIGDSGSGKSCWVCHTALTYLKQGYATFFYRGSDIEEGIFNAISQDLNWSFSPQYDEIQGIKRLLEIFRQGAVLILVDGLDEMSLHSARKILTQFVRRAEETKAKLIATCKTGTWVKLLEYDSVPTSLALKVFQTDEGKGYQLSEFDDQEFFYMLEKYRAFYQYFGGFDSDVYEACKQSPFLLRIMFEVAADQRWDYISYAAIDFYKAYFRKLSSRFEQREVIQRILTSIARTLYMHNAEELEFEVLATELGLSPTETIPERLFELNVLERFERDNTTYIGFYFKKLRDYLIAFRALKWQNFSPEDFQSEIEKREVSSVRLDALNLYYSLASDEHKRVLDGLLYDNAQKYAHLYQELLDNNFPSFKSAFPPYTAGPIGFVGYLDLSKRVITYHGFRPIKGTDKTVFFFPKSIEHDNRNLAARVYLYGPLKWRGSSIDFPALDITKEVIWEEVKPHLEGIIEHGELDESLNKNLLLERVLVTCLRHYKDYFQLQQQDPAASYLPLDLRKLKEFVLYKIAHHVLISRRLERNDEPGTIEEKWDGSIRSRSISFTFKEQTELEEQAWAIAKNGEDLSNETHFNRSSDYGKFLLRDIESLARLGVTAIVSSPLTDWYNKNRLGLPLPLQWDTDSLVSLSQFVENLYLYFLQEYRILVERNFPTLCQHFDLYSHMPLNLMVAVECENEPLPLINYPDVTVLTYTDGSQVQNTVLLSSRAEIQRKKDEIWHDPEHYARSESNTLFLNTQSYMPFEVDKQRCVLRNLVYERVKEELKQAFFKLAAKY